MPFDFNALLNDPSFQFGASIIGNTGQQGVVGSALANMARVNQLKQEAESQRQRMKIEQGTLDETTRYHTAEIGNSKEERRIQQEQFQRQQGLAELQAQKQAQQEAFQQQIMQAIGPKLGIQIPPMQQQSAQMPGQQTQQGATMPGGAQMQQMRADYNIPQGGNLNMPPVQGMIGGAQMQPALPVPQGAGAPGMMGDFNPDDPRDPAGPFTNRGGFGAPEVSPRGRHMKRTGAGSGDTGAYGTPSALLDNLQNVESSGNPYAINKQTGAMGSYQFLPQTVDTLRRQGHDFSPFNPDQARNAADFYLSQLVQQHGGDWNKAVAAYGGFKDKDPTSYVSRVTQGVNAPPAQASGMQGPPMANKGLDIAQAGAMMALAGLPGGNTLAQVGGMMKPENVPAGSYRSDPTSGQTQFMGDPYKERELEQHARQIALDAQRVGLEGARVTNDTTRTGIDVAKGQQELQSGAQKLAEKQAQDAATLRTTTSSMDRMGNVARDILKSPGLGANTGVLGALGAGNIPGTAGRDTKAQLDTLRSRIVIDTLQRLKADSSNGSSGFGQLSDKEGTRLENYIANLDKAQSEQSMRKALQDIVNFSESSKRNYNATYQSVYGRGKMPTAQEPQQAPQAAPAKGGIQFMGFE